MLQKRLYSRLESSCLKINQTYVSGFVKGSIVWVRTEWRNNRKVEKTRVAKIFLKFSLQQCDDSPVLGRPIGTCLSRGLFSTFSFFVSVYNSHNFYRIFLSNISHTPYPTSPQTFIYTFKHISTEGLDCFNPGSSFYKVKSINCWECLTFLAQ